MSLTSVVYLKYKYSVVKIFDYVELGACVGGARQTQTAVLQTYDKLLLYAGIRKYLTLIFLLESPQKTLSHWDA